MKTAKEAIEAEDMVRNPPRCRTCKNWENQWYEDKNLGDCPIQEIMTKGQFGCVKWIKKDESALRHI